jgi:WD40 repeat protein
MRISVKKRPMGVTPTPVRSLALSGRLIAAGDSSSIRIGGRILANLPSGVKEIDFSPCGRYLLSVSECGGCRIHDTKTFRFVENLVPRGGVTAACWGNIMPICAYSTVVDTVHFSHLPREFYVPGVKRLQFFNNDCGLRAYSSDGSVTEWEVSSGETLRSYHFPFQYKEGDLAYNVEEGNLTVFSKEPLAILRHPANILAVAMDEYRIIVGLSNKEIIAWYYVIE